MCCIVFKSVWYHHKEYFDFLGMIVKLSVMKELYLESTVYVMYSISNLPQKGNFKCPSERSCRMSLKKVISHVLQKGNIECPSQKEFLMSLKKVMIECPSKGNYKCPPKRSNQMSLKRATLCFSTLSSRSQTSPSQCSNPNK